MRRGTSGQGTEADRGSPVVIAKTKPKRGETGVRSVNPSPTDGAHFPNSTPGTILLIGETDAA